MQFCKGESAVKAFREKLQPFRDTLQQYQFLGGTSPCYADMYLLSMFMVRIPDSCINIPLVSLQHCSSCYCPNPACMDRLLTSVCKLMRQNDIRAKAQC